MDAFFRSLYVLVLSAGGLTALAALDASAVFFLPLAVDFAVVALVASDPDRFWLYPLLATAGSAVGAGFTYWLGRMVGRGSLERLVPPEKMDRARRIVEAKGAVALALPALIPPPFPFTAFVLASGALAVPAPTFFSTLIALRLVRFGGEAWLARSHGPAIARWLESDAAAAVVALLIALAVIGSAATIWRLRERTG